MFTNRITIACLILLPWAVSAAASTLSVTVIDNQTGETVPETRIIVNGAPAPKAISAEMVQKNRQFRPNVLIVPKNSRVDFPNKDRTQHHVYSFSPAKSFNLELFADQPEAPVIFDKAGVVEVGCNIHDNMQGFILVTDSSVTARTDSSGTARLQLPDSLTTGSDLSLSLWHPRLTDATRTVNRTISLPVTDPLEFSLDLAPAPSKTGRLDGLQKRYRDL